MEKKKYIETCNGKCSCWGKYQLQLRCSQTTAGSHFVFCICCDSFSEELKLGNV